MNIWWEYNLISGSVASAGQTHIINGDRVGDDDINRTVFDWTHLILLLPQLFPSRRPPLLLSEEQMWMIGGTS